MGALSKALLAFGVTIAAIVIFGILFFRIGFIAAFIVPAPLIIGASISNRLREDKEEY
ncbi:MAG: hypothetical protein FWC69_02870 [Defluviitaleaceae bacterium]|nr:hypothetical protein [Defluviitaleaceae bacterium]